RGDEQHLDALGLDLLDQRREVLLRRRNARLLLDLAADVDAEAVAEVHPGLVIRDDLQPAQRLGLLEPAAELAVAALRLEVVDQLVSPRPPLEPARAVL